MAVVSPSEPCYILFRLDDKGWLLVVFIPDKSRVTDKLVYAATAPTLRRMLGPAIIDEVQFSVLPVRIILSISFLVLILVLPVFITGAPLVVIQGSQNRRSLSH